MRVLSAHKKPINCVAFSPDGTQLAEAAHGGTVRVWDLASGTVARTVEVYGRFPNRVRLAFAPDGKQLAATNEDIVFVDLATDHRRRVRGGTTPFFEAAYFPDGKSVVGVGERVGRYSAITGGAFPRMKLPRWNFVIEWSACAISRDGTRLAIGRSVAGRFGDRLRDVEQLLIHDPTANAVVAQFEWTRHAVRRVAFSPDGALVAAAGGLVLRVWNVPGQALVAERRVGRAHFQGMAFSPDGRYVATVSRDKTTRLWRAGDWGEPKTYEWDVGALLDVAFSPDGATAAVASDRGKIVLFDVD